MSGNDHADEGLSYRHDGSTIPRGYHCRGLSTIAAGGEQPDRDVNESYVHLEAILEIVRTSDPDGFWSYYCIHTVAGTWE
jgi:hypothetical protein